MYSMKVNCEEVYHFGVKGMRWGIRRTPEELGQNKEYPRDKESIKQMSDQDLQAKINRLQKERTYKDLTQNPALRTAKKAAAGFLAAVTTIAFTEVMKDFSKELIKNFIKSHI